MRRRSNEIENAYKSTLIFITLDAIFILIFIIFIAFLTLTFIIFYVILYP